MLLAAAGAIRRRHFADGGIQWKLSSSNLGISHLNEARCINYLSRGSVLGYEILTNN